MSVLRRAEFRRAQAIVEFALVLPLFVLLLFGFIDFARLEFSYISLANATREMARVAAMSGNVDDNMLDSFNNQAIMASDWSTLATKDTVKITVTDRSGNPLTQTCVLTPTHGTPAVRGLLHSSSADPDRCPALPARLGNVGGSVEILVSYQFTFNPLFENRLTGMIDAPFTQSLAKLTTTARAYIE